MRHARLLLVALAALAATPAAAVVVSLGTSLDAPAGSTVLDFDTPPPAGFRFSGAGAIVVGNWSSHYAAPVANGLPDVTEYFAVNGTAKIFSLHGFSEVSLYWGSPGDFGLGSAVHDRLTLFAADGSVIGSYTPDAIGLTQDGRVTFDIASGDAAIYGIGLTSNGPAFEVDNIAFSGVTGSVPEPATWAMTLGGFGLLGGAMRRRRSAVIRAFG